MDDQNYPEDVLRLVYGDDLDDDLVGDVQSQFDVAGDFVSFREFMTGCRQVLSEEDVIKVKNAMNKHNITEVFIPG